MTAATPSQIDWVTQKFHAFERALNGSARGPVHALREKAFQDFSRLGFPTPQQEDWRYTNVAPIARGNFDLVPAAEIQAEQIALAATRIPKALSPWTALFVDGTFVPSASTLPNEGAGLRVCSLREVFKSGSLDRDVEACLAQLASSREQPFIALNTSFLRDGLLIHARKGTKLAEPINVVFVNGQNRLPVFIPARVLVIAEENAELTIIENYIGASDSEYLVNQVTEIFAASGALVDHYKVQNDSAAAFHYGAVSASVGRDSMFRTHCFSLGGLLVRNEVYPVLNGSGTTAVLNGLSVMRSSQHVDNSTVIDHAKPHCESHELYKGIYADKSTGVFSGTIIVRPDAQKTNALQTNQSILLSPDATVESRPQLKIWADDVKCTHGATVGQLDEHALFYLRSRGVPKDDARNMLIHAFASDVISSVKVAELKAMLEEMLSNRLSQIGAL